jgi:hypothetical protein
MEIRWSPEQRLEDVKSFLDRVVAGIEGKSIDEPIIANTLAPNQGKKPASNRLLTEMELKLVGTWHGDNSITETPITFGNDGTFSHETSTATVDTVSGKVIQGTSTPGRKESGTWTLEGKRLTRRVKESGSADRVGAVVAHEIVEITNSRLVLKAIDAEERKKFTYTYTRRDEEPKRNQPGNVMKPRRADVLGKWYGDDNGLAQVFFVLNLKDDGSFELERRDNAPQFEAVTCGVWELDGERPGLILRSTRWVEDGEPVAGRKNQTESLSVVRKSGKWILTHPVHGKYVRHEAAEEE